MSDRSVLGLAADTDPMAIRVRGLVRRLAVTAARWPIWQVAGVRSAAGVAEAIALEVFGALGIQARPASTSKTEAIAASVGGRADGQVIVATRDEATAAAARSAVGGLDAGDALVHSLTSSPLVVHLDASAGTVEVRSAGGAAVSLATLADLEALRAYVADHIHTGVTTGGGVSGSPPPLPPLPTPTGTTVLKGE